MAGLVHFLMAARTRLAGFTSKAFYEDDGGLVLMRQGSANNHKDCFAAFQTGGSRSPYTKLVENEVEKTIGLLDDIINNKATCTVPNWWVLGSLRSIRQV
jgi:hypothetical protein